MRRILVSGLVAAGAVLAVLVAYSPMSAVRAQTEKPANVEIAVFAGGCFWCVESDFDHVPGVVETISGYTGGHLENPTYKDVYSETSGHREAVQITYDPSKVSYDQLLDVFWHSVDPTDADGQFCDRGESYTTAIYTIDENQQALAETSKTKAMDELGRKIVTVIEPASIFYPAEDYHQDFYKTNPVRYKAYRFGCRRDAKVESLWKAEAHRGIMK